MKYLLNCNLYVDSYSIDYTLVGIFDTKEDAYKYMEDYNNKVVSFNKDNSSLIQDTMYDPINEPQFKDYVIEIAKDLKCWDYEKLECEDNKEVKAKIDILNMKKKEKMKLLDKKIYEEGLMLYESTDYEGPEFFKFDLNKKDNYIDEFDGKPTCLCSYRE